MSSELEKLISAARDRFGAGDWRAGEKYLAQAGELAPNDPSILDILGRSRLQRGEMSGALEALEAAVRLDPENAASLEALAMAQGAASRFDEALGNYHKAIELNPGQARLWNNLGELLGRGDRLHDAIEAFGNAIKLAPDKPTARLNLALALTAFGQYQTAIQELRTYLTAFPGQVPALLCLGSCHNALGDYQRAENCFRKVLTAQPGHTQALTFLGASLQYAGRLQEAADCYRQALAINPGVVDAQCNLGRLLVIADQDHDARLALDAVLRRDPEHPVALCGLAMLDDKAGDPKSGLQRLSHLLEVAEPDPDIVICAARLQRSLGEPQKSVAMLEKLTEKESLRRDSRVQLHFSMGRSLDGMERYEEAAEWFRRANRLRQVEYHGDELEQIVSRSIDFFSIDRFSQLPVSSNQSERPVFVVGLPRSGKSLLENVLKEHSAVHAVGERPVVGELANDLANGNLAYPESLLTVSLKSLDQKAAEYLQATGSGSDGILRTLDTLPGNFLYIGLIRLLFPAGRVICCNRSYRDLGLYCFMKNFAGNSFSFSFVEENLVHYFTQYKRMMDHWLNLLGQNIHSLDYQDLVTDPQTVTRLVIEFLGLDPGENKSALGLHRDEIDQYQHYQPWMGSMFDRLGALS